MEPISLDPASQWDQATTQVLFNVYDTLVKIDPKSFKILPSLAVNWKAERDGKVWVFILRRGVKFSNGKPLTSEDVVFSFRRLLKKEAGKFFFYFLKDVKAEGPYKVVFSLKKKFSPFLHVLTMVQASVVYGKDGKFKPIGTGPYMVSLWEKGKRMILKKNPYYWGLTGNVNKIVLIFNLSMNSIYALLMDGKLDMTNAISVTRVDALKNSDKFHLHSFPVLSLAFLIFNPSDPWAKNLYLREALSYLWNPEWVKLSYREFRKPACRILTFHEKECLWEYNPRKAEKIIKSRGIKGKAELSLIYPENSLLTRMFLPFVRKAEEYGIRIRLFPVKDPDRLKILARREYSMAYYLWLWDYPEPYSMLSFLLPEGKMPPYYPTLMSFPQSFLLREKLQRALSIISQVERCKLYGSLESSIRKFYPLIPLHQLKLSIFSSSRVKGIFIDPAGILRYQYLNKE